MEYKLPGIPRYWLQRQHPSAAGITPAMRNRIDRTLMRTLERLTTKTITPYQVVDALEDLVQDNAPKVRVVNEGHPFGEDNLKDAYFVKERSRNAFALINPGHPRADLRNGVNIIVAHVDAPILRVRTQPTYFEYVDDRKFSHPGPYLEVLPYGGLSAVDWMGLNGVLAGRIIDGKGREHNVRINARIPHSSLHLQEEEPSSFNGVRIFTGVTSVDKMFNQFGIKSEKDFGGAELYFYPDTDFMRFGDYVSAYGMDDRACVTAAAHAFLEARPSRPTFVFGLDAEEIGSIGTSGGVTGFFRRVLTSYLSARLKSKEPLTLEQLYARDIIGRVPAICADVSPTPGFNEDDAGATIPLESAKHGFGPFICPSWGSFDGNVVSPYHIRYMQEVMRRTFNGNTNKWQMVGAESRSGQATDQFVAHFAEYFTNDHVPMIAVGVPVADLHRPSGEMLFYADLFRTAEAYKSYMEFAAPRRLLYPEGRTPRVPART